MLQHDSESHVMILTDKLGPSYGQDILNVGQMVTNMMMIISIEKNHKIKVTTLKNQQCEPTELFLTINRTSQPVVMEKDQIYVLIDVAIPGDRNVTKREAEKVLEYTDLKTKIQCMWSVEAKVIQYSNSRGKWNHLKVTQTIPEQHTVKARYQVTAKNSHTGHCTHTAGSASVEEQNVYRGK